MRQKIKAENGREVKNSSKKKKIGNEKGVYRI